MALKFGKADAFEVPQLRMFRVILMLGNYQYVRGTLAQMCVYEYQKEHKHVIWEMLQNDLACGNEEIGEISFAELSRCTTGDTRLHHAEHVEKMYRLLPVFKACVSDIEGDLNISGGGSGYVGIRSDCVEVNQVTALMRSHINKTQRRVQTSYNAAILKVSGGVTLNMVIKSGYISRGPRQTIERFYQKDVSGKLAEAAEKLKEDCDVWEGEEWDEVWHHMDEVKAAMFASGQPVASEEEDEEKDELEDCEEEEKEQATGKTLVTGDVEVVAEEEDSDWGSDEPLLNAIVGQQTYKVSHITRNFTSKGVKYLTVKWVGHPGTTNEPEEELRRDIPEEVELFYREKKRMAAIAKKRNMRLKRKDPAYKPSDDNGGPSKRAC